MAHSPGTMTGTTALVTGASRGIGRSVVRRLSRDGVRVWAAARSRNLLEELARESGAEPLPMDVRDEASVWDAADRLADTLGGPPDIVVNNAGIFHIAPLAQETVRGFDEMMAVNLRGAFLVVRAFLPGMLARGSGTIVNVGSVSGRKAYPGNGAYSASKYGLRGLHEVLVEEVRGTGVRATLVEPAATNTPLWDPLDPDSDPRLPSREAMLSPEHVADAVAYIASRPPEVSIPVLQIERG
ncbi:MAG: SDR family oxidoreductase [Gemmatimonadota bacterium]